MIFRYQGRTKTGAQKKGTIEAANRNAAIAKLRSQGINPRVIEESKSVLHYEISLSNKVKHKDFIIYLRQYATLIRAGITVVDATHILQQQTSSKPLKKALIDVEEDIRQGVAFSEAAARHPKVFPPIFVNMMRAGEASGNIDDTLERLADSMAKQYSLKKKVQATLTYPAVLLIITLLVSFFLMIFVVPTFVAMFEDLDIELPWITKAVLAISHFLQKYWWLIIGGLIGTMLGLRQLYMTNAKLNYQVNVAILKMPIFGPLLQKSVIARMTRTLSSLFSSAVPILQALTIVEKIVGNPVVAKVVGQAKLSLQQGGTLSEPLAKSWLFPPLVHQMTAIGEQTGSLDHMLEKVADFYEEEVDRTVDTLKSLIEPLMILFLAAVVGTVVAAILLPMLTMYENI